MLYVLLLKNEWVKMLCVIFFHYAHNVFFFARWVDVGPELAWMENLRPPYQFLLHDPQ